MIWLFFAKHVHIKNKLPIFMPLTHFVLLMTPLGRQNVSPWRGFLGVPLGVPCRRRDPVPPRVGLVLGGVPPPLVLLPLPRRQRLLPLRLLQRVMMVQRHRGVVGLGLLGVAAEAVELLAARVRPERRGG